MEVSISKIIPIQTCLDRWNNGKALINLVRKALKAALYVLSQEVRFLASEQLGEFALPTMATEMHTDNTIRAVTYSYSPLVLGSVCDPCRG